MLGFAHDVVDRVLGRDRSPYISGIFASSRFDCFIRFSKEGTECVGTTCPRLFCWSTIIIEESLGKDHLPSLQLSITLLACACG